MRRRTEHSTPKKTGNENRVQNGAANELKFRSHLNLLRRIIRSYGGVSPEGVTGS